MQLFLGHFFSFQPEQVPFITFARAVYRDRLLLDSQRGDRIAFVVTKKEVPAVERRGRLFGMAEIGAAAFDTGDVVDTKLIPAREWVGGGPRFSKAIPMLRAWRFTDKPYLPTGIDRRLAEWDSGIAVRLSPREAASIFAFSCEGVAIRETEALLEERHIAAGLRSARSPRNILL
jgi:hypothetical protein